MTNKPKSSQLRHLSTSYVSKYIKVSVWLFTLLNFKDSFSEYELQTKVKRLLLKKLESYEACIKLFFIRLFQGCSLEKYFF